MTSKRASKLSLARQFAEGNVAPVSRSSGLMGAMCLPFGSRSSPIRSLRSKKYDSDPRQADRSQSVPRSQPENSAAKRRQRDRAQSSTRSQTDSAFFENDFLWTGNTSKPYPGLDKEDELWLPDGDCTVFFTEKNNERSATASLRVLSSAIRRADIAFLNQLLDRGRQRSQSKQTPSTLYTGQGQTPRCHNAQPLTPLGQRASRSSSQLDERLPFHRSTSSPSVPQSNSGARRLHHSYESIRTSNKEQIPMRHSDETISAATATRYEIWFAVPAHLNGQERKKHKLALRNLLAIIHNKAVVGSDPITAITDVQEIVVAFSGGSSRRSSWAKRADGFDLRNPLGTSLVAAYVRDFGFDDVRGNLSSALKLLAWSELPSVQWACGYVETYAHVVGMMTHRTPQSQNFKRLSQATRYNLIDAFNNVRLVVTEAEEQLKCFSLSQMWTLQKLGSCGPRKSFNHFARMLNDFYAAEYGTWPPMPRSGSQGWLNRTLIKRLQIDFAALYEYLVDREVKWTGNRMMHDTKRYFSADEVFPIASILLDFDDFHGLAHIPHPFPLLPEDSPAPSPKKSFGQNFIRRSSAASYNLRTDAKATSAFAIASNSNSLSYHAETNKLLLAFQTMEYNDPHLDVTPQEARLGRWALIYGVLQVLSLLSVDIHGLRHTTGVDYFLCTTLRGCPPWKDGRLPQNILEASQLRSYCWEAPHAWPRRSKSVVTPVTPITPITPITPTWFDEERRPGLSQLQMGSMISGTSWYNSELAYSPVSEGAARVLPIQYGIKGTLFNVKRGGNMGSVVR